MTTVSDLLFASPSEGQRVLSAAFETAPGLGQMTIGGLTVPSIDISSALLRLFQVPLGNLALRGWNFQREVERAKTETALDPDGREVLKLFEHKIRSHQSPTIELRAGDLAVTVAKLTAEVEIVITSAELVIERGEISGLEPGEAKASAKLKAGDAVIAERSAVPVRLRFGTGGSETS